MLVALALFAALPPIEMVLQNGGEARHVALSADGRRVVTAYLREALLWQDGKLLRRFALPPGAERAALSRDGALLAAGIRVYRADGTVVCEVEAEAKLSLVAFLPDARSFVASSWDEKTLGRYDATTCKPIGPIWGKVGAQDLALSPDGALALVAVNGGMQLWTTAGASVGVLGKFGSHDFTFAWSADGQRAVTCWTDNKLCKLWARTGERLEESGQFRYAVAPDQPHDGPRAVAFARDGEHLFVGGARLRKLKLDGTPVFEVPGSAVTGVNFVAAHPDGRHVVVGSERVIELSLDGRPTRFLTRKDTSTGYVTELAFSPDGEHLFAGMSEGPSVVTWSRELRVSDRASATHRLAQDNVTTLTALAGGGFAFAGTYQDAVWRRAPDGSVSAWFVPPKRARLVAAVAAGLAVATDEELLFFDGTTARRLLALPSAPRALASAPDASGVLVCGGYADGRVVRVGLDGARTVLVASDGREERLGAAAFSADGRRVALTYDAEVSVLDLATGAELRRFPRDLFSAVALSPQGDLLALGEPRKKGDAATAVQIFDVASGRTLQRLTGHVGPLEAAAFSPDGRVLATGTTDKTLRLWRVDRPGAVTLFAHDEGWVAFAPDGLFDASARGGDMVAMVRGDEAFAIDQFALKNNRPDLLLERMGFGTVEERAHYHAEWQRRLARQGLSEKQVAAEGPVPEARIVKSQREGRTVVLEAELTDRQVPLASYQVFVNDVPLFGAAGKRLAGKSAAVRESVVLGPGKNRIEIAVINRRGAESLRAFVEESHTEPLPADLYFLGFGVSRYAREELSLEFAAKDAQDLGAALGKLAGKRFGAVHSKVLVDAEVTPANLAAAKRLLDGARPEDVYVLFIAGHGVHDRDRASTYYYLTHGADPARLAKTAVPFEQIEALLHDVAPRHKLFLMDTCESGEATERSGAPALLAEAASRGIRSRGLKVGVARASAPSPRRYLAVRDRFIYNDLVRRSGTIVFSSSRGGELSFESPAIENGFFTEELLAGLGGAADRDRDGRVGVRELERYVSERVPEATSGLQHPTVDRDNLFVDFSF